MSDDLYREVERLQREVNEAQSRWARAEDEYGGSHPTTGQCRAILDSLDRELQEALR